MENGWFSIDKILKFLFNRENIISKMLDAITVTVKKCKDRIYNDGTEMIDNLLKYYQKI